MSLLVEWISPDGTVTQLDPSSVDGDTGVTRSGTGFNGLFNAGDLPWIPFIDPQPQSGGFYRGGVFDQRGGVSIPIYSECGTLAKLLSEIDFLGRITSPYNGLSVIRVTQGSRVRHCKAFRTGFKSFYASPDSPEGAFGILDNGQLAFVLSCQAPSPYWYTGLAEIGAGEFADDDTLVVTNDSGVPWGVYIEATPTVGKFQAPLITNETTNRVFMVTENVNFDEVLKVDWYGSDPDALSVVISRGSGDEDLMPKVFEPSFLEIVPGDNVLRFSMSGLWDVSVQSIARYESI